jgi:hypothetical protein
MSCVLWSVVFLILVIWLFSFSPLLSVISLLTLAAVICEAAEE